MPKKTVQKLEVVEIKTYKCSDGSVYDTEEAALSHEQFLKDCNNNPLITNKIKELERKILELEAENATLSARITALEAKKSYPWGKPNPDIYPQPWPPYQQPQNPMTPTPKFPSESGDVVYDAAELSKLSDEELIKRGYTVTYAGHKRSIIPYVDLSTVCGNTASPEYNK